MSSIIYLAIINNKDEPIVLNNYLSNKENELQLQLNCLSSLDIIDLYGKTDIFRY